MSTLVVDDLPAFLLRFYAEDQWARDLAFHGRLRMWRLKYYATLDGSRGDPTEGESSLRIPGSVPRVAVDTTTGAFSDPWEEPGFFNFSGTLVNPTYTFSASTPGVDMTFAHSHFGQHVVRVVNPEDFASRLYDALGKIAMPDDRELHFLDACAVRYDKGEIADHPHGETRTRIHFAQKPRRYERESEYRFAAVFGGATEGSPEYIDLQLDEFESLFEYAPGPGSAPA